MKGREKGGESPFMVTIGDVPCDISPLLSSLLLPMGPDISAADRVDDLRVVIWNMADLPRAATLMGELAPFFDVPSSVVKHTLGDEVAMMRGVFFLLTPFAGVVFIPPVNLPSIGEVIDPSIKDHSGEP
jgi:hypothetical protein